jgi:hypothetical protein
MQRTQEQLRSGSRAQNDRFTWEDEWRDAAAVERLEAERSPGERAVRVALGVMPAAVLAALLPAIFPLTPGFSAADTLVAVVAAAVTAIVAVAAVPATSARGRPFARTDTRVFTVALLSAGAAAIHFAVVKMHFDEYTLFGVFFVGAGIAQLVWSLWILLRPSRLLAMLGALGNGLIVGLWGVDRIWGLPLGPEHWNPEPVGFGDSVTAGFELLLVAGCVMLLAGDRERPLRTSAAATLALVVASLTALSLLSVLGVGSSFLTPTA